MAECWDILASMPTVFSHLSEYGRLAQLALAIPIGSVENERTFTAMNYLKPPTRNKLSTNLNVVVRLFAQNILTLKTFYYERAFAVCGLVQLSVVATA
jgi:hypothetical protein